MKSLKFIALGLIFFLFTSIEAQVSVNVQLGSPPAWGPSGYSNVEYYYLPDVQMYYDIRASQFIYFNNNKWNRSRYLPKHHKNYDLYSGYKVVLVDYHGNSPYTHFKTHKIKYYKGYKGKSQKPIGNKNYSHKNNVENNKNGKGHKK